MDDITIRRGQGVTGVGADEDNIGDGDENNARRKYKYERRKGAGDNMSRVE